MKLFAYIFMILLYSTGLSYGQIFNNFSTVRSVKNYFVENKGQWSSEVLFLAETKNMNVWITGNSLIFDIFKVNHFPYNDQKRTINPKSPADSEVISGYVVKMKLSVSNNSQIFSEKIILPGNPLDRYNNYFIGNNPEHWASNVQLYDSVYIQHYIPGMDLKLYFDEGKFRYDLICHPGIDPNNIVFGFEGQDDISLIENNTFSLETGIGKLFHGDLSTYQPSAGKNFEVNSGFRLISENEVGLVVGIFDPTKDFIIDPLVYSSYLGGSNIDYAYDIDMDRNGNAVVGGATASSNYPTTSGAYKRTAAGSYDIFITKFNSTGTNISFSTYLGGSGADYLYALALDYIGNCYITGSTASSNYPATTGCYQGTRAGVDDAMVTKMNAGGTAIVFSTYIGGWWYDYAQDIELDATNNIYISGHTSMFSILQTNYPVTSGAYQTSLNGDYDAFITKLNSTGTSLLYSTYLGGSGTDYSYDLAIDASGNVYVTGYTQSSNFPRTTGCYQNTLRGTQDVYVTKINSTGSALSYSTLLGGTSNNEQGMAIVADGSGYAYVTGRTNSNNFPIVTGAYRTTYSGGVDGFITKVNTNGTALSASTYFGRTGSDQPADIALDINYNIVIAGTSSSTNLPTTFCAIQTASGGGSDLFAAALNNSLSSLIYSTYLGGSGNETATGLVINGYGEVFLSGYTASSNYPVSSGAFDETANGNIDAIAAKLPYVALGMNYTFDFEYCAGTPLSVPFVAGCSYNSGNIFSVQLSDSAGSFGSAVTIGSAVRQTSGTINCLIPENTAGSSKYRIRMVSTNPAGTSLDNGFDIEIYPKPSAQFILNSDTQCLNVNKFLFTDTSSISKGALNYKWTFGDNTSSVSENPVHIYSYDSTYAVSMIATSDSGCSDTASKVITVLTSPDVSYSVTDSIQCRNYNLFPFSSSTSIRKGTFSLLWNFGDGDTSSLKNISHSYKYSGNFDALLIASANNGCADSLVHNMLVLPSPDASFQINDSAQCLNNNNFIFTNSTTISKGSSTYLWVFGDGNTSTLTNPTHMYLSPDNYSVLLIATSDSGCKDSAFKTTGIFPLPVASFNINNPVQCYNGNSFGFTNTSTLSKGKIYFSWDFGDTKSDTSKNPVHSYVNDGSFNVRLVAYSSAECTDTAQKIVTVNPSPSSSFDVADTDQCYNENLFIFNNTSTIKSGSLNNEWQFGDGITSTSVSTTHTYSAEKIYMVKLINTSNLGCKDSAYQNVIVYPSPVSSYFVTDTSMCFSGNFFSFSNNSMISSGSLSYLWLYGDGKSDTVKSTSHSYSMHGNYIAKLVAISDKKCTDTFSRNIHVYPMPVAGFMLNNNSQCYKGNNFICTNTSAIANGNMSYSWDFGDGITSTLVNPVHFYTNSNKYNIRLITNSDYGCSDTVIQSVQIYQMPIASFSFNQVCLNENTTFTDFSIINLPDSITTWLWRFGDGSTSAAQNPVYMYTSPGTYNASLTVGSNNGCRDSLSKSVHVAENVSEPVINYVSVRNDAGDIEIGWAKPAIGDVLNYVLEKSTDSINYKVLTNPSPNWDRYIDAAVKPHEKSYYYRIKAIDSCNFHSNYSNIGKSILLSINNTNHIAELKWSAYQNWTEGVNRYDIEVYVNTIFDFRYVGTVDGNTLEFNDDITALNQSEYCYRVAAFRNGTESVSYSDTSCIPVVFACFIPNAFTPNGDGLNDTLLALGTSVTQFNLMVFDRWGRKVFESNDINVGWDGKFKGTDQPEGYYYFQMSARGVKNSRMIVKGTLMLVRPALQ